MPVLMVGMRGAIVRGREGGDVLGANRRQVLDGDGSGEITSFEFCSTLKKLVNPPASLSQPSRPKPECQQRPASPPPFPRHRIPLDPPI